MEIRQSTEADLPDLLHIQNQAFGPEEGPVVADLVNKLLCDPSAIPYLSLLATDGHKAIGHILFTKAAITGYEDSISAAILAPLAVIPESQCQGVGGKLMRAALQQLSASGVDLVFLAGYPDYYSRHGFQPARTLGFVPPLSHAARTCRCLDGASDSAGDPRNCLRTSHLRRYPQPPRLLARIACF